LGPICSHWSPDEWDIKVSYLFHEEYIHQTWDLLEFLPANFNAVGGPEIAYVGTGILNEFSLIRMLISGSTTEGCVLAQGNNHRFLILMITKYMLLFSTNKVQVFNCVSGLKRIQEVFFLYRKKLETQGYSSMGLELKTLDIAIGESRLNSLVVT